MPKAMEICRGEILIALLSSTVLVVHSALAIKNVAREYRPTVQLIKTVFNILVLVALIYSWKRMRFNLSAGRIPYLICTHRH